MDVPWKAWLRAFREANPHQVSWIHVGSGEVRRYNPRRSSRRKLERLEAELYSDEQWVEVPYAESDDEYMAMRLFAASPEAGRASKHLLFALEEEKPFRAFRDALKNAPAVEARWQHQRTEEAARRLWAICVAYELPCDHPHFLRIAAQEAAADALGEAETQLETQSEPQLGLPRHIRDLVTASESGPESERGPKKNQDD